MIRSIFFFLFLFIAKTCFLQGSDPGVRWAASEVSKMTLDEKIGQLFMIRAHSDLGPDHIKEVEKQIKNYHVGGLCFFQGTPKKQAELTQRYQNLSKRPLMVAVDAEWGLGMRFTKKGDAISFPKQLTLGAIEDNNLIYEMGVEIAQQLKMIGAHINFAPVVDVNNNPANPVIHNRSFGEDMYNVATKAYAYMKGMQDSGILACAKHFPGHGDTDSDSHYDLPIIPHSLERIQSLEMMPFRVMAQLGVGSMMTAHLQVNSIDDRHNRPTSLSHIAIKKMLIGDLGFEGLIFTDGLEMKGVADHFAPGDMEIEALLAGNDVLLLPINIEVAFVKIKNAIVEGLINEAEIDQKVAKIMKAKHKLGLQNKPIIPNISAIPKNVNNNNALALKAKLYKKAITLVKDEEDLLPLRNYSNKRIATLAIGPKTLSPFQNRVSDYSPATHFNLKKTFSESEKQNILKKLSLFDLVLVNLHDLSIYASKEYGINSELLNLLFAIKAQNKLILTVHGTPYCLKFLNTFPQIIMAYENDDIMQDQVAQAIFGAIPFEGQLPVSVSDFKYKTGKRKASLSRLSYCLPEEVGINSDSLLLIDTIVQEMMDKKAAPGCQILAVKDGKVFFEKSYGYHTYDKKTKLESDHILDVASVTKILATTISMMKLHDEGKINIYNPIKSYISETDTCNKGDLIIEDVLAHQARLPAWIPFYANTVEKKKKVTIPLKKYYRAVSTDSFNIEVAKDMYLRSDFKDSIYSRIYACGLETTDRYKYSDLGFYMFKEIVERKSNQSFDAYCESAFYNPLGLKHTCFNPYKFGGTYTVVPSEDDSYFRNQVINGYVHDMGAAMLGGVSGHAGLFSNTSNLAVLMQMLLNGGHYGGVQYIKPETVQKFTSRYSKSTRRGLGFDMKETDKNKKLNMSELASDSTFGHLGFTGASIFADPENNFIYIFLSNRTFPTMENRVFGKKNYRPRVQSAFYSAMLNEN